MKADKPWQRHSEPRLPASNDKPWQRPLPKRDDLLPNTKEASRFLAMLDPDGDAFSFATFDDGPKPKRDHLTFGCIHGSIEQKASRLTLLNQQGAGIFVMVNAGDGVKRGLDHVRAIRAVWGEFDDGIPQGLPLRPSLTVETSPGKYHCYWLCRELAIADHRPIMDRICKDWGGDRQARDEARVLRVPGFYHRKGKPFLVRIVDGQGQRYNREEILAAFPPHVEEKPEAAPAPAYEPQDDDEERLMSALAAIPADDRDVWCSVGMALKAHMGEHGLAIWADWARKSTKYDDAGLKKWNSFGRREGLTIASVFHMAKEHGWKWERPALPTPPNIQASIDALIEDAKKKREASNVVSLPSPPINDGEFIFDENFKPDVPPALIRNLLPRNGLVVDGGQSGAGKTFAEVDMAVALASLGDWFGQPVRERVGVVYIAAEGQASIQRRFIAAKRHRGLAGEALPIALPTWPSINLRDPKSRLGIITKLKAINEQMRARFGVRLGCVILDTVSASCPMKDENSNAEVAVVCRELREIADAIDGVLVAVHHFGKNEESGFRSASAWRSNSDHCRIFLATRDGVGTPARDRKMALEKSRVGQEGEIIEFDLAVVPFGSDAYGDEITECAITAKGKAIKKPRMTKLEKDFSRFFYEALGSFVHAEVWGLRPDGRAVPIDAVRDKFKQTVASGQERLTREQSEALRSAWNRTFKASQEKMFISETIGGIEWVWPNPELQL